ncbi:MAG: hypothetical protein IT385_23995 [Deltaproteobacteria bacterium]|nr:hypothetical protein [Deltaproteobacteria bacterium]
MQYESRPPLPKSPSSEEVTKKRSSKELIGMPYEQQLERLTPKDEHAPQDKGPKTSEQWVSHVAKWYGLVAEEAFFDALRNRDDDLDLSGAVAVVAPVLAKVQAQNTWLAVGLTLGRALRYEELTGPDVVLDAIMHDDAEAKLVIPKEYTKAAEAQRLKQEALQERLVEHERKKEQYRRETIAEELGVPYDEVRERVDLAVKILDAYIAENQGLIVYKTPKTLVVLGEAMAENGAKDAQSISAILSRMEQGATIPSSVDPEGAKLQALEREKVELARKEKEAQVDKEEDTNFDKQKKLRTEEQRLRSGRLVEGAQSLHGKLRWCPSGFEFGKLGEHEKAWYELQGMKPPQSGQGDPRARQLSKKDEVIENAFTQWVRCDPLYDPDYQGKPAPEPSVGSFMNCWEGVIFAAFKAGLIEKKTIIEVYRLCKQSGSPDDALMRWLGYDKSCAFKEGRREPAVGDIIFYGFNEHVAIHKGGGRVLQLWHDGRLSELLDCVIAKEDHRESDWEELSSIGHEIRFAPSPF